MESGRLRILGQRPAIPVVCVLIWAVSDLRRYRSGPVPDPHHACLVEMIVRRRDVEPITKRRVVSAAVEVSHTQLFFEPRDKLIYFRMWLERCAPEHR